MFIELALILLQRTLSSTALNRYRKDQMEVILHSTLTLQLNNTAYERICSNTKQYLLVVWRCCRVHDVCCELRTCYVCILALLRRACDKDSKWRLRNWLGFGHVILAGFRFGHHIPSLWIILLLQEYLYFYDVDRPVGISLKASSRVPLTFF